MLFEFDNNELVKIYETGRGSYPPEIIKAFFKKIQLIKNAKNENDLRKIKSNHFEKMEGYKNRYSLRLNLQYRLIIELLKDGIYKIILIKEISNHYSK